MTTKCTPRERAFAREYVKDFNITAASEALGMSRTTAYKLIAREDVQDLIESEMQKRVTRTQLDMDRIIKELAIITQSDITDYFDNVGGRLLTLKELHELPPEQTRCIQAVKEKIDMMGNVTIELKLYDKLKAIQIVAQSLTTMIQQMREFLGMTQEASNVTGSSTQTVKVLGAPGKTPTLEEWDQQMRDLESRKGQSTTNIYDDPVIVDASYTELEDQEETT